MSVRNERQALVYADEGVCLHSANAIVEQLKDLLHPSISVLKIDSHYLKREAWEDKTVVLVMGGGRCSSWDEQLESEGINKIYRYVNEGGGYIGLCAGAYFAAAESRFNTEGSPIEKKRPLAFFPGKAVGPLIQTDDYLSLSAARAAEVSCKIGGLSQIGSVYYQGGCFFDQEEDTPDVEIMSIHQSLAARKAAAVFCKVGRGSAWLDGTHPEFKWQAILSKGSVHLFEELVQKLSPQELFRQKVWEEIGTKMKLPMKPKYLLSI